MIRSQKLLLLIIVLIASSCSQLGTYTLDRNPAGQESESCSAGLGHFFAAEAKSLVSSNKSAEALTRLFKKFEIDSKKLYPSSGFKNSKELKLKLAASSVSAKKAAKILADEELEVTIAVPMDIRDQIVSKGFLNFRESKQSQGAILNRDIVEANYAGMKVEEYTALDPVLKPKYGYIGPKPDADLSEPLAVKIYGPDHFIFKLDKIRDRTTFTIGDSLNRHINYTGGSDQLAQTWDQRFMPWDKRELIAPAIASGIEEKKLGLSMSVFTSSRKEVEEDLPFGAQKNLIQLDVASDATTQVRWTSLEGGVTPPEGLKEYKTAWGSSLDYIEVQIWDKLTLDDVSVFEFRENPPEGEFLKTLLAHGIEIRDGR